MEHPSLVRAENIEALHFRMARAGVNLSIRELAQMTGLNKATIVRLEAGGTVRPASKIAAREALETLGANFWICQPSDKIVISVDRNLC
jgi:DNA-binding XRE family transcriptional regulator